MELLLSRRVLLENAAHFLYIIGANILTTE